MPFFVLPEGRNRVGNSRKPRANQVSEYYVRTHIPRFAGLQVQLDMYRNCSGLAFKLKVSIVTDFERGEQIRTHTPLLLINTPGSLRVWGKCGTGSSPFQGVDLESFQMAFLCAAIAYQVGKQVLCYRD